MKAPNILFFITTALIINLVASSADTPVGTTVHEFYLHDGWIKYVLPQKNPVWIVFPGMLNTSKIAAKYMGTRGFISLHGHIKCNNTIDIILDSPFLDGVEPYEIINKNHNNDVSWLKKIHRKIQTSFFKRVLTHAKDNMQVIPAPNTPHHEHNVNNYMVDISYLNIAQQDDIDMFAARYEACSQQFPQQPKVGVGHSRGSAIIFNSLAQKQYSDFACVILFGCFDSMAHICEYYPPAWIKHKGGAASLKWLLTRLTAHELYGITPLNMAPSFPKNTPILLVTSHKERVVPVECTAALAHALAQHGHPHVYLLILNNTTHFGYHCDDETDKKTVEYVTHALYKQCDLPHIPHYALAGEPLLAQCHIPATQQLTAA